jgi:hypothetical protein
MGVSRGERFLPPAVQWNGNCSWHLPYHGEGVQRVCTITYRCVRLALIIWFYLETSWYTIIQYQPEAESVPRVAQMLEALQQLSDSSAESQPEEEPMDERILNANPAEWASITAEARQLASENWAVEGAATDLRLREDRLASHINRLARYHGEVEPNEIPNPEGELRWPGLALMAQEHEEEFPQSEYAHQDMLEWFARNPPQSFQWQRARASAGEVLAAL